jgi:hypothetical protein
MGEEEEAGAALNEELASRLAEYKPMVAAAPVRWTMYSGLGHCPAAALSTSVHTHGSGALRVCQLPGTRPSNV